MNIYKLKYLFFSFLFFIGCFNFCSAKSRHQFYVTVPKYIIAKSDSFIISKTGLNLFKKYFIRVENDVEENINDWDLHPSKAVAKDHNPNAPYNVLYMFHIPGKKWIDEPIRFCFDSVGNMIQGFTYGIPEFLSNPDSCTFVIDSVTAINIARQTGLKQGYDKWKVGFGFTIEVQIRKYTWCIKNCLSSNWCPGYGDIILIDASSGSIIKRQWACQY
jgi:hypothetical protein